MKQSIEKKLELMIKNQQGYDGTDSTLIAQNLVDNKISSNIIIFTDGEVSQEVVQKTDEKLRNYELDNIDCYIIGKNSVNMSVTCPFTRNNNSRVYSKSNYTELSVPQYTKLDPTLFETLDTINLDTFREKYNTLEDCIISRNMGKSGDLEMKNKLLKLNKNLSQELANANNAFKIETCNPLSLPHSCHIDIMFTIFSRKCWSVSLKAASVSLSTSSTPIT